MVIGLATGGRAQAGPSDQATWRMVAGPWLAEQRGPYELLLAGNINGASNPNCLPQAWRAADGSFSDLTSAQLTLIAR